MKPAEVAFANDRFLQKVESMKGNDLLDKWIDFEGSAESKVPDLGLQKSLCLEARLKQVFGIDGWNEAVETRRKTKSNAQRPSL